MSRDANIENLQILLRNPLPDRQCSSIEIHSLLFCKNSRACCHPCQTVSSFFSDRQLEVIAFCINASLLTGVYMYDACVCVCALSVCPSVGGSLVFSLTDAIGLLMYSTHSVTTQGQLLGSIRHRDLTEGCNRQTHRKPARSVCVWSPAA